MTLGHLGQFDQIRSSCDSRTYKVLSRSNYISMLGIFYCSLCMKLLRIKPVSHSLVRRIRSWRLKSLELYILNICTERKVKYFVKYTHQYGNIMFDCFVRLPPLAGPWRLALEESRIALWPSTNRSIREFWMKVNLSLLRLLSTKLLVYPRSYGIQSV